MPTIGARRRPGFRPSLGTPPYGNSRILALVIVLTALVLASAAPAGPTSYTAHAQAAESSLEYAENGTAPVAAFIAHDQDGDPIEWSLSGPDEDVFTIDGGVLAFREPPDFEEPRSRSASENLYRVTVEASGGVHDVYVTVTDVDEAGAVSISRPQPQVDRPLSASLSDEDEGVTDQRWEWARSEDGTTWTDIEGAISPARVPTPDDVDMYLRARVTYSDKFGTNKTASAVSANRVEPRTLANAAPTFADQDGDQATPYVDIARSVEENATVGTPIGSVPATDADEDVLFYELLDTPDLRDARGRARFTIDSATGQIRVGKVLGADAGEREDEDSTGLAGSPPLPDDEGADVADNSEYVLRVRASDPSTASATVNVIVTVADVNEPPRFVDEDAPTLLRVRENADPPSITFRDGDTPVVEGTYAVVDLDVDETGPHPYDDRSYSYSVTGPDSDVLAFDSAGVLSFREEHEIDYEEQASYSITVVAHSGTGPRRLPATLDVAIEVVDEEDPGEAVLSQREPQVGREVHARVSDPDGGVRIKEWVWERSDEITVDEGGTPSAECLDDPDTGIDAVGGWTPIDGGASLVYTPGAADVGRCLRATATYTDNIENPVGAPDERLTEVTEAPVQSRRPVNAAPQFLVQSGRSRRVAENTEAGHDIGRPVEAHDEDGDLLIYTLGGPDSASFDISRNNGQLKTKAPLDYEAKRSHSLVVTATDPSGASTGIRVTVFVRGVNEPARITGTHSVTYAENGISPVAAFRAHDQDGGFIRWSLGGRDAGRFTIGRGVLDFRDPPDYEFPRSAVEGVPLAERNVYRVTVRASGGAHDVTVTLKNLDEEGAVSISRPQPQVDRPFSASLWDEDEGVAGERWQWARSGDGAAWMDIEGATSPRRTPTTADVDMYLRATVIYSDGFGAGKTVSAESAYPVEPRTLANAAPSFADQDGDASTPYIDVVRTVAENTAAGIPIGEPVSAKDADEDVLFYELLDTPDLEDEDGHARFTIDSPSGQIRVAEPLGADAGEREDEDSTSLSGGPLLPAGEDAGEADNSEYVLRVRVSDPSTASDTVNVIVRVTEVNEPPLFDEDAPTVLRVRENVAPPVITLDDGETPVSANTYAATDQDGDGCCAYSVSGADRSYFTFSRAGVLGFRAGRRPDYERKSSYSITIVARSGQGARSMFASLAVTIEVVDTEDDGSVFLSQRQPQVGIEILATLSDPDGGVSLDRWVWERSDEAPSTRCRSYTGGWTPIERASSAVYIPRPADVGRCLRVTAVYTDELDDDDQRATGVLEVPARGPRPAPITDPEPEEDVGFVNAAPVFPDQDFLTDGDQSDRTSRTVAENTRAGQNIGDPVSAIDADGDLLIYTLSGADARSFGISRNDGQLRTRASLNYERKNSYTVVVTATDPFGAADSIEVTINVTDVDDPPVITVRPGG